MNNAGLVWAVVAIIGAAAAILALLNRLIKYVGIKLEYQSDKYILPSYLSWSLTEFWGSWVGVWGQHQMVYLYNAGKQEQAQFVLIAMIIAAVTLGLFASGGKKWMKWVQAAACIITSVIIAILLGMSTLRIMIGV